MKLGYDARWMTGNYRGMGRFAHALLAPVARSALGLLPAGADDGASLTTPVSRSHGSLFPWWEQVALPAACRREHLTHLLCPYNTGPVRLARATRLILVVHDLIFMEGADAMPQSVSAYQTAGRYYRRLVTPRCVRRADRIVTVSHHTRRELVDRLGVRDADITVIPNSIGPQWFAHAPVELSDRGRYVLAVAGEAPSKNVPGLLAGFAGFASERRDCDWTLRVVGVKPKYHEHFRALAVRLGLERSVVFESFVDAAALQGLYRNAWMFVMPSFYEGFGIPLLEAMASGTPIACSNTSSLPEVTDGAAVLFDPRDPSSIAQRMGIAADDAVLRAANARRGLARARAYSHEVVEQDIVRFWETEGAPGARH